MNKTDLDRAVWISLSEIEAMCEKYFDAGYKMAEENMSAEIRNIMEQLRRQNIKINFSKKQTV